MHTSRILRGSWPAGVVLAMAMLAPAGPLPVVKACRIVRTIDGRRGHAIIDTVLRACSQPWADKFVFVPRPPLHTPYRKSCASKSIVPNDNKFLISITYRCCTAAPISDSATFRQSALNPRRRSAHPMS